MLIHIVIWKYTAETSQEMRESHIAKLRNLPNVIPHIKSFKVGADILNLDRSYDTGLVATFPDQDALDSYTVHEEHQKVATMGKDIAEHAASVDFFD